MILSSKASAIKMLISKDTLLNILKMEVKMAAL